MKAELRATETTSGTEFFEKQDRITRQLGGLLEVCILTEIDELLT